MLIVFFYSSLFQVYLVKLITDYTANNCVVITIFFSQMSSQMITWLGKNHLPKQLFTVHQIDQTETISTSAKYQLLHWVKILGDLFTVRTIEKMIINALLKKLKSHATYSWLHVEVSSVVETGNSDRNSKHCLMCFEKKSWHMQGWLSVSWRLG